MNKAFVREPDDRGELHCPACGSLGIAVERETWQTHVQAGVASTLAETGFFCPYAKCNVAYFDMFERRVTVDQLVHSVWPKDPDAPICPCFGLTADDVQADIAEGAATRVRELLAKASSPAARCRTLAASGQCCAPEVQRYYMKLRSAG